MPFWLARSVVFWWFLIGIVGAALFARGLIQLVSMVGLRPEMLKPSYFAFPLLLFAGYALVGVTGLGVLTNRRWALVLFRMLAPLLLAYSILGPLVAGAPGPWDWVLILLAVLSVIAAFWAKPRDRIVSAIRVTRVPAGEAPPEIRGAWVGMVLPLKHKRVSRYLTAGVVSGPRGLLAVLKHLLTFRYKVQGGYIVQSSVAIAALEAANPQAAKWWRDNTRFNNRSRRNLLFPEDCCEAID